MSFIDRFLSIFRGGDNGPTSRNINTAATSTDPFKIHTAVRIDGMTYSSDLKTFFLIDSGKLITFPLDTPSGLVIGNVFGRLTFAAQIRTELSASERSISPPPLLASSDSQNLAAAAEDRLVLTLENANWSPQFFPDENTIGLIGVTDLDAFFKTEDPKPGDLNLKLGLIPTGKTIKIFNDGTSIVVTGQNISTKGFEVPV